MEEAKIESEMLQTIKIMGAFPTNLDAQVERLERFLILAALNQADGVHAHAAALLGIHRPRLIYKLKKYGFPIKEKEKSNDSERTGE